MSIINNRIAILGLARSGLSLINFIKNNYLQVQIHIFDDNPNNLISGESIITSSTEHTPWKEIEYLVVSPGIDTHKPHSVIDQARSNGVKIIVDIELFFLLNSKKKFVGITGTNGKSTTTALINHILKLSEYKVEMGGNIGIPIFDLSRDTDVYIIEVSSYQLDLLSKTRFDIGILLNISEDHLERYNNMMQNYIDSKKRIITLSGDIIIATNNKITKEIFFNTQDAISASHSLEESHLIGEHNQENIAAARKVCEMLKIEDSIITEGIKSFTGLPHRLEFIEQYKNTKIINDSKATSATATISALKAFDEKIYLILGGISKSDGLDPLKEYLQKIEKIYLIGESQNNFTKFLIKNNYNNFIICNELRIACENAIKDISGCKAVILFSPACASFDQFKNFEHRGEMFGEIIKDLIMKLK